MSTELKPGYKLTEVGVIPEDWQVKPLFSLSTEIGDGIHSTPSHVAGRCILAVLAGPIGLAIHPVQLGAESRNCAVRPHSLAEEAASLT